MRYLALALLALLVCSPIAVAAAIHGTVLRSDRDVPVAAAEVSIVESGFVTRSDELGAFTLVVPDGPFSLVVAKEGYRVHRVVVSPPLPDRLEVRLEPIATFTDQVEVTASRARTGRDPVSVTNIPREEIAEAHWGQDPALLLATVAPGFYAYNDNGNGIGYSYFTIRGFGQARTRVTLNGAPLNDAESGELFFIDLADFLATSGDIQIQRGVFGLSGIGGAVDITTATPPVHPSFTLHGGFGSYDTQRLTARYSSGLIDGRWSLDVRYSKISTDGYRDLAWVDMWNYYLSLVRFGERSTLRLVMFGGPEETHLAYYGVPRSVLDGGLTGDPDDDRRFNPLSWPGEIDTFTQPHYQLVHQLQFTPRTRLDQTFYLFQGQGYYEQFKSDRRLAEYNLPNVELPDGSVIARSDLVRRRTVDEWDAGWVPTLRHDAGAWSFTVRGEARLHRAHHFGEVRWAQFYPSGAPPNNRYYDYRVEKRSGAVAGEATWRAGARVTFQGGLELAHHTYEMDRDAVRGVEFSDSFDFVLPRIGAVVALAPGADLYAHLARGMREPAFRTLYDPQDYYGTRTFLEPEDVWDWEVGIALHGTAWQLRANAFWMEFANEIVYAGALDDSGVPIYGNGARSLHRGVELEGAWQAIDRLELAATVTLSRNTFTEYHEFGWDGGTTAYDGNRIAGYPDQLARLTARTVVGPASVAATLRRVGRFFLDNSEDNRRDPELRSEPGYVPLSNPPHTLVDLALHLDSGAPVRRALGLSEVTLDLRVNNALDERYTSFGYVDGGEPQFIPSAGRNLYFGLTIGM